MCGRVNVTDNEGVRLLMELVGMPSWPTIQARYNIAPTQALDVLAGSELQLQHNVMNWGIVPSWAKPGQFNRPLINARSETIWEKPSFKQLIKNQRVLVPITGFYEWHRVDDTKTPYYIYPAGAAAMFLAGIYQTNNDGVTEVSLITTAANDTMARVHHRMPVIVKPDLVPVWLGNSSQEELNQLMQPAANDSLNMHEVSNFVNSSRNQGEECSKAV